MSEEESQVAKARLASALTLDDASRITGLSRATYERLEEHPLEFSLGEMRALASELNPDGRSILKGWLLTFFRL